MSPNDENKNSISIRVDITDLNLMMNDCKELFLFHNPKFEGMKLSRKFMFKKIVKFYLEG